MKGAGSKLCPTRLPSRIVISFSTLYTTNNQYCTCPPLSLPGSHYKTLLVTAVQEPEWPHATPQHKSGHRLAQMITSQKQQKMPAAVVQSIQTTLVGRHMLVRANTCADWIHRTTQQYVQTAVEISQRCTSTAAPWVNQA